MKESTERPLDNWTEDYIARTKKRKRQDHAQKSEWEVQSYYNRKLKKYDTE